MILLFISLQLKLMRYWHAKIQPSEFSRETSYYLNTLCRRQLHAWPVLLRSIKIWVP